MPKGHWAFSQYGLVGRFWCVVSWTLVSLLSKSKLALRSCKAPWDLPLGPLSAQPPCSAKSMSFLFPKNVSPPSALLLAGLLSSPQVSS